MTWIQIISSVVVLNIVFFAFVCLRSVSLWEDIDLDKAAWIVCAFCCASFTLIALVAIFGVGVWPGTICTILWGLVSLLMMDRLLKALYGRGDDYRRDDDDDTPEGPTDWEGFDKVRGSWEGSLV
jgi:hypothetical protein